MPPRLLSDACNLDGIHRLGEHVWCHSLREQPLACTSAYLVVRLRDFDGVGVALCVYNEATRDCVASRPFACPGTPPAPPSAPPSPPPTREEHLRWVEQEVNRRFLQGLPSNELERTGLLLRKFDSAGILKFSSNKLLHPFQLMPLTMDFLREKGLDVWSPSTSVSSVRERFSSSIVNRNTPWTIDGGGIGIVLDPELSRETILCAYADDGETYEWVVDCEHNPHWQPCIPGCLSPRRKWCPPHPPWTLQCSWQPSQLEQMMQLQVNHNRFGSNWTNRPTAGRGGCIGNTMPGRCYNEVVQSSSKFEARLPGIVQAFFVQEETVRCGQLGCPGVAKAIRQAFLRHYNLGEHEAPPLLRYDPLAPSETHFHLIDQTVPGALRLSELGSFLRPAKTFGLLG